jgi:hypothetical protein
MRRTVELHVFALLTASALGALLTGCGDDRAPEKPKTTGSHVWRGQTDMYFEARDVAKDVNAQLNAQEAALERARRGD